MKNRLIVGKVEITKEPGNGRYSRALHQSHEAKSSEKRVYDALPSEIPPAQISDSRAVQRDSIDDRNVMLFSAGPGMYYIGPGPNGRYALVHTGDGCFEMAYARSLREGRFVHELDPSA